ncbi:MAG: hypothetical protein JRI25_07565 [Deltaproteobacteria bacterium]|nr:hypothetical protein [Deltaproteobacteria bacterium]
MRGPAHDQLHVFLGEFIPAVQAIGEEKDPAAAQEQLAALRELVEAYDTHFE